MRVYSKVGAAKILTCFAVVYTKLSRKIAKRRGGEWRFEEKDWRKGDIKKYAHFLNYPTYIFCHENFVYFLSKKYQKQSRSSFFRNFKIKRQSLRFYLLYLEFMGVESYNPGWRWIKNVPKSAISLDFINESASHSSLSLEWISDTISIPIFMIFWPSAWKFVLGKIIKIIIQGKTSSIFLTRISTIRKSNADSWNQSQRIFFGSLIKNSRRMSRPTS